MVWSIFGDLVAEVLFHYLPITTVGLILFAIAGIINPALFSLWPWVIAVAVCLTLDVAYATWRAN